MSAALQVQQPRRRRRRVFVGVDTHQLTHHAAVVDQAGRVLADQQFEVSTDGYQALTGWAAEYGQVITVGVEQTGSYGAALARHLTATGITVIEVNTFDIGARILRGKTDQLDAVAAARAVASGRAKTVVKDTTGEVEALRCLKIAHDTAVRARTVAINQMRDLWTTAPAPIRETLGGKPGTAAFRQHCLALPLTGTGPDHAVAVALRCLTGRINALNTEIKDLTAAMTPIVEHLAPHLLALRQVGIQIAAQIIVTAGQNLHRLHSEAAFARLCGIAPIPASSGKTSRHRLHRGGDRQANRALYLIAVGRLKNHPETRAYRDRRQAEGRTTNDIIRCLKRYIAREVFRELTLDLNPPKTTPTKG